MTGTIVTWSKSSRAWQRCQTNFFSYGCFQVSLGSLLAGPSPYASAILLTTCFSFRPGFSEIPSKLPPCVGVPVYPLPTSSCLFKQDLKELQEGSLPCVPHLVHRNTHAHFAPMPLRGQTSPDNSTSPHCQRNSPAPLS